MDNLFISSLTLFTIHGSLTMYNCTMQSEAVVMNLKGGIFSLSKIEGKETDLQSCFDRHFIRLVKTLLLGKGYNDNLFQGNI